MESNHPSAHGPTFCDGIVGQSAVWRDVLSQVETVACTDTTVLVLGETGTGKELIARAIHRRSQRSRAALVKFNCAAVPSGLLESELFGHERGAFTGAVARRTGRFELAHEGTMFLDEIGEMPLETQPKLLRLLQEREFERLGSSHTLKANVRLIAATNRDLSALCEARLFREDLFYRLDVFPIRLPSLRERKDDIPVLAAHFIRHFAARMNKQVAGISNAALRALQEHDWPGNVRELENVIERAVILARGPVLEVTLKPTPLARGDMAPLGDRLDDVNRAHIISVLERTNGVVSGPNGAAARLGLKRSTLNFRLKKLGIQRPDTFAPSQGAIALTR